jgi:hypothetical protein
MSNQEADMVWEVKPYSDLTLGEFRRFTAHLPDEADIHLGSDQERASEHTVILSVAIPPASQCDGQPGLIIHYEQRDVLDDLARAFWRKRRAGG